MWIAIPILAVMIVLGVATTWMVWRRSKEGKQQATNYRVFFLMGITFFPIGIILLIFSFTSDTSIAIGIPFLVMGITYLVIGLANRDKWDDK
jgi:uncharacterized membrane protein HdeD (DUF308 family)